MTNTLQTRRRMLEAFALLALTPVSGANANTSPSFRFGQVNRLTAKRGMRGKLRRELLALPGPEISGCQLYKTAMDATDRDAFWTFEIWESAAAHNIAIEHPSIRASIERCKVMVREFENWATFNF